MPLSIVASRRPDTSNTDGSTCASAGSENDSPAASPETSPRSRRIDSDARSLPLSHTPSELYRCPSSTHVGSLWSCGTHTYAVPVHEPPLLSVATKLIAYTRPFP